MGDGHENTAIVKKERSDYNAEAVALIKQTVAHGATDAELSLFLYTAKRTGLDPLLKQIYCVKRWNVKEQRETMAIQTGIDGYRLIASRTGELAGIDDPLYMEKDNLPQAATVTVYRRSCGQSKDSYTATARWTEYVQKTKNGEPTSMWQKMPYLMLGKCAESLALRKAFPAELSGLYTHEEMQQADNEVTKLPLKISEEARAQVAETQAAVHGFFNKDNPPPERKADSVLPPTPSLDVETSEIPINDAATDANDARVRYHGQIIGNAPTFGDMTRAIQAAEAEAKQPAAKLLANGIDSLRQQYWTRKKAMGWKTKKEREQEVV